MFDELRQIATFTNVAESKSFAGAARKLNVSPSIVSHHVSQLEKRFDVALIYRSTRRLRLTKAGEELAEVGRQMLGSVDAASNFLRKVKVEHEGNLRIAAPTIFHDWLDIEVFPKFTRQFPDVTIQIEYGDNRKNLIDDEIDLAFRFGRLEYKSMASHRLLSGPRFICASKEFLEQNHEILKPNDLHDIAAIVHSDYDQHWRLKNFSNIRLRKNLKPKIKVATNSINSIYRLTLAGVGISVLPEFLVASALIDGRLIHVLKEWMPPKYEAYLVWPRNAGSNSITHQFVKFCKEEVSGDRRMIYPEYTVI